MKKYRETHREKYKKYHKELYEKNKKTVLDRQKKRYELNRKVILKKHRDYKKTPEGRESTRRAASKRRTLKKGNGGSYTREQWKQCLEYFDYKDAYTGLPMDIISIDHVIPLSKGGTNFIHNLVPTSRSINARKHNSDLFEWYSKQEYFDWNRYIKICLWIIKNL